MSVRKPKCCSGCPLEHDPTAPYVPSSCTCDVCNTTSTKEIACEGNMVLVGIAPSYQEVASGKPLVGPAGRKVDAAIKWALSVLKRKETALTVRKTNIVRCRTTQPGKRGPVNRDPTKSEVAHCTKRHLIHELDNSNIKVIVPMGELVHSILCSAKFKQCVGSRIKYGTERIRAHMEVLWTKHKA